MVIDTADRLYLFFDRERPKFFVCIDPILNLYSPHLPLFPLAPEWWCDYSVLHGWLHEQLGNSCQGKTNSKVRRSGRDSDFSNLVRCGSTGDGGCFDTPLMDIDAVRTSDNGEILRVIESKQPGERMDASQARVLIALERSGTPVELQGSAESAMRLALGLPLDPDL